VEVFAIIDGEVCELLFTFELNWSSFVRMLILWISCANLTFANMLVVESDSLVGFSDKLVFDFMLVNYYLNNRLIILLFMLLKIMKLKANDIYLPIYKANNNTIAYIH
jgi:hypothetical protein